jgi:L-iditol 2-dehydrogenase
MKALRLHGAGDLRLADEAPPVPGPGEALVRVTAVGICGSDLHWYDESGIGDAVLTRPLVLGHEAAGVIADGPRAGQRVAIDPSVPCSACETCALGRGHLCPQVRFLGHSTTDGAMRELIAWPEANLVPLPDSIDEAAGAMLEPLGVAIHALRLAKVRPGDTVGVFGCGPIGLLLIQLAHAAGATTVLATDRLPHRVAAAADLGAIAALVDGGAERDALLQATGGRGVDAAIEIAGDDDAIDCAIALTRPAGTVVIAGIPAGDQSTITASVARRKGLDLRFSRRMVHTYPQAIALVEAGRVDVGAVVSHLFALADFDAAFRTAVRREGHKVLVTPAG